MSRSERIAEAIAGIALVTNFAAWITIGWNGIGLRVFVLSLVIMVGAVVFVLVIRRKK